MSNAENRLRDREILDVIRIISANGESGRLQITSGTAEASLFFKSGQLVDASVGHLRGFRAVNAVAAMRDAQFSFDPTAIPPVVSSITPNERVVLKQFFGIDTVAPDAEESPVYSDDNEATIETQRIPIPVEALPVVPLDVPDVPDAPARRSLYRGAMVLAALFILIALGAVALRNQYRERVLPAAAATTSEQPATTTEQPATTTKQPATPVVAEEVKTSSAPATVETPVTVTKPKATRDVQTAPDLSGKWSVVNTVQKTAYRPFEKMAIGFNLSINQNGKSFTGRGEKVSENGRSLPADSRTPIRVKGSIDGDRVEATFFEEGTLRKTNGRFVWRIDKAGTLNGTFVSTAAGSSGKSAARKS